MRDEPDDNYIEANISLSDEEDDISFFTSNGVTSDIDAPPRNEIYDQPMGINEVFDGSSELSTEAFPALNSSRDEENLFQPDQGTMKDEAEFSSHTVDPKPPGSSINGVYKPPKPEDGQQNSFPEQNKTSLPRRQRGNSNDRSRMRAEEICHDNFIFVPKFDYHYTESGDIKSEIEEWFLYEDNDMFSSFKLQYVNLHTTGKDFSTCQLACSTTNSADWVFLSNEEKTTLLSSHIDQLKSSDDVTRRSSVACLAYIALGGYGNVLSTSDHIQQIRRNTKFLWEHGAIKPLYQLLIELINKKVPETLFDFDDNSNETPDYSQNFSGTIDDELLNTLTILYIILENHRNNPDFARDIDALDPPLLQFFISAIGRLRWGVSGDLPLRNMFLFFWKALLCLFGDSKKMENTKSYMRQKFNLPDQVDSDEVTASPLDYHAFRQDIISRYPAYVPPSSTLPDTFENTQSMAHYIEIPRPVHAQPSNNALPIPTVHIATPAPSPPASPAIAAGQKLKKSVFMTNQSFPFIHPTDDNVPQSIIEASELFAVRVRTTPEMVQLWEERDRFMQQERGWITTQKSQPKVKAKHKSVAEAIVLDRIEELYIGTISQLNSFILVVLKFILASISFTSSEGHIDTYYLQHQGSGIPQRAKEISLKAVSSVLDLLTSWYKISHVVKFEYISTLLFDSRYYLLVFKYFYLHTPLESALQISDNPRHGFFHFASHFSDSWDSTMPPPQMPAPPLSPGEAQFCEEVRVFSNRYFYTTINLVRVLRRIITGKTQRIIIVAELPPMTLRKALSIYQRDVWEVVLEIFKEQVPFNGRKWKYNNMILVSAIYMHCKTKLRDDWLVGGDVNQELDDAHSQEIAIRALIQFYNDRIRDEAIKAKETVATALTQEPDFFSLELEALSLNSAMP